MIGLQSKHSNRAVMHQFKEYEHASQLATRNMTVTQVQETLDREWIPS